MSPENPEEGLVGMGVVVGSPPPEQGTLLVKAEGLPDEPAGLFRGHAGRGVDRDDPLAAGEGEELAQDTPTS
jgi:hypothetical protein